MKTRSSSPESRWILVIPEILELQAFKFLSELYTESEIHRTTVL